MARVERDFKGHLIVADDCQWFRTTDVNGYRVSTIGEWLPPAAIWRITNGVKQQYPGLYRPGEYYDPGPDGFHEIRVSLDPKRPALYETMVFELATTPCECGCGAPMVDNWSGLEQRRYSTRDEAIAGHEDICATVETWNAPIPRAEQHG